MALSNKFGAIVLTTGNKSEMAVGYATLYGDMAGGFGVLKDISKTLVYRLARYRHPPRGRLTGRATQRPASGQPAAGQAEQESLPPHRVLAALLAGYLRHG